MRDSVIAYTQKERKPDEVPMADKIQRVSVNLTPKEDDALRRYADDRQVSCSWVARQAIVEYLDRHAGSRQALPLEAVKGQRR